MKPQILEDIPLYTIRISDKLAEPFGDAPYLGQIEHYSEHAFVRKAEGAQWLMIRGTSCLHEARAAVLGAKTTGLPIFVSLRADELTQEELLAALICLQALGVAGFGLDLPSINHEMIALVNWLFPYAETGLFVQSAASISAAYWRLLLQAGVRYILLPAGDAQAAASIHTAMAEEILPAKPPRPEDAPILLSDGSGVYYLEEDFTLSEEISCSWDMLANILAQEEMAYDALCFRLENVDDAHFLGQNSHMMRSAACLQAATAEALEMGLLLYAGRALVDARSEVDPTFMRQCAQNYGAVIR